MKQRIGGTIASLALAGLLVLSGCNDPAEAPAAPASDPAVETAPSAAAAPVAATSPDPHVGAAPSGDPEPEPDAEASATPAPRKVAHLRPQDECAGLPGWRAFRARLADAIARRDSKALVALTAPDVTLDYGGGHGHDELTRRLSAPQTGTALWSDLATIMPMGCDTRDGLLVIPWFFWNVPESADPGEAMLATGAAVPLLSRAKADADPVATLDWEIVTLQPGFDAARRFTAVETEDGLKGQVETRNLRSVLARRMIVERGDAGWQVTAIVAGD
ncbi:hypothetical protein [Novosphingobium huizhouense]|uniref:hypothetical protein n=1 Tax=Novosphingobium huizhouense TaxID=2866625 RepID=UPI001CD8E033|nr:hypothetical protein [Novosphingobium huizhouense]